MKRSVRRCLHTLNQWGEEARRGGGGEGGGVEGHTPPAAKLLVSAREVRAWWDAMHSAMHLQVQIMQPPPRG